jgi:hypothetical protein
VAYKAPTISRTQKENKLKTTLRLFAVIIIACASAFAWPSCSGQWVSVPQGTSSANGALYSTGDLLFQCQKPTDPTKPTSAIATSTSSSNSTASANSGSTSSATGGNATANGGSSTSKSGVVNSGNSSNTNNNTANGGAGGNASQSQSNSSTNSNQSSAANNGNNSNNSVTNVAAAKIPVATAFASAQSSAPCVKGFGAGVQTLPVGGTFGASKVDTGCDDRENARTYALIGSRLAACKTLVYGKKNQKLAKKHPEQAVTVDDCMQQDEQQAVVAAPSVPQPSPVAPVAITVNAPPAQVTVLPVLHEELTVTATRAQVRAAQQSVKPVVKKRTAPKPCTVPDSLKQPMGK